MAQLSPLLIQFLGMVDPSMAKSSSKTELELHWTGDVSVEQDAKITIEEGALFTWTKQTWNLKMPLQPC